MIGPRQSCTETNIEQYLIGRGSERLVLREPLSRRQEVGIFVANVTSFGNAVKQWIHDEGQKWDAIGIIEHHLEAEAVKAEKQRWGNHGWTSNWAEARPTGRSERGTHGGVAWMRRAAYQTSEFAPLLGAEAKRDLHDADIAVFIWRFRHVELAFITIYLDCSIGLDGGPNVRKLRTLLAVTKALRLPWVAIGDFNVKPAEWAKTKWLEELGGRIILPTNARYTCNAGSESANMLDYGIMAEGFAAYFCGLEVVRGLPWGPHLGLHLRVLARPASVHVRVALTPKCMRVPMREVQVPKSVKRRIREKQGEPAEPSTYRKMRAAAATINTGRRQWKPNDVSAANPTACFVARWLSRWQSRMPSSWGFSTTGGLRVLKCL